MVLLTTSEHSNTVKGNKKKLVTSFCLGVVCLIIAVVVVLVDPVMIVTRIKMKVTEGSIAYEFLQNPMECVHIHAYLFNITNAERFMGGEDSKLRVEQVGPFVYKELRYNERLELDLEAGVIRYEPRLEAIFMPKESVADPAKVSVTMPNMPMLGIASRISSYPYWTKMGFNMLTSQINSKPIVTVNASTYLWGYKEPLVTLAHNLVPGLISFDKMGILDRMLDKESKNKLIVGARADDKFMIKNRNGHKKIPMGPTNPDECELCEDFDNSYEGFFYPSGITKETPIRIFRTGLCRMLDMVYNRTVVMDNGAEGLVYNLSDNFYSLDPNATKNKILDLTDCYFGLPIGISKVNFLGMEPEFYEKIEGLKQDPKQESFIIIEPKIAVELETYYPVQMNLMLKDLSYSSAASPFSNMVIPIGYVEIIQPPLPEETLVAIKLIYVTGPILVILSEVLLVMATVVFLTYSIVIYFRVNKKMISFPVSKIGNQNVISAQEPLMCNKPNGVLS